MLWAIIMELVTQSIYIRFGLQRLINVGLGLKFNWIFNKTHLTSSQVVYLFILSKPNKSITKLVN